MVIFAWRKFRGNVGKTFYVINVPKLNQIRSTYRIIEVIYVSAVMNFSFKFVTIFSISDG